MSTLRVHQLAKELGISSKELILKLRSLGVEAKNHFAVLDEKTAELVKAELKNEGQKPKDNIQKGQQVKKAKKAKEEKEKAKPVQEETSEEVEEEAKLKLPQLEIEEGTTVKGFAEKVDKNPAEVIKMLMNLGEMTTINQLISPEAIGVLAEELGYEVKIVPSAEEIDKRQLSTKDLEPRAPVVTVMGHVDHGKTRLLDAIRQTDVISSEAGGITQHIGAYQVVHDGKPITFLDTPGHEAFTAMRARGAKATDVAVLVVAADDGVMPQTVEAIDHAKAAKVPIVVAINKIDKPEANPDKVKKQLGELGLVSEEWGGETVFVSVSAKEKTNLDDLLDMILLVAEMQELKASKRCPASGVAIEAKIDKGRGPVVTVLVEEGTLRVGGAVVAGLAYGKIRAMLDYKGEKVEVALPSQPVEILGLSQPPQAGDSVVVVADEKLARSIAEERALKKRLIERSMTRHITLDDLYERIKKGQLQELKLVIKADVQGSVEALAESLAKLDQSEVKINIIHKGVGAISETDVMLAAASDAIVIGFNVRPDVKAKEMAAREKVDLRTYNVIYKIVEDIDASRKGLLKPIEEEVEEGLVEVRATFKMPKVGMVAGCYVGKGRVARGLQARLVRDGKVVYEGKIASLRRFKEDATEVLEGYECGVGLQDFQDIKEGDLIEVFSVVLKPPK